MTSIVAPNDILGFLTYDHLKLVLKNGVCAENGRRYFMGFWRVVWSFQIVLFKSLKVSFGLRTGHNHLYDPQT